MVKQIKKKETDRLEGQICQDDFLWRGSFFHLGCVTPDPTAHQNNKRFADNELNQLRQHEVCLFSSCSSHKASGAPNSSSPIQPDEQWRRRKTIVFFFPHRRLLAVRPIFPRLCMLSTFAHTNTPGVPVPPPPPLVLAPPRLSAVAWGGCFHGSLAESSSRCLQTWPPHLTLTVVYSSSFCTFCLRLVF